MTKDEEADDGGPAFASGDPVHGGWAGMSLRAYIATAVLASIGTWMPSGAYTDLTSPDAMQARAEWAVRQADALLSALKGKE